MCSPDCIYLSAADVPKTAICTTQLNDKSMQAFQNAIKKYYWYAPLWGKGLSKHPAICFGGAE